MITIMLIINSLNAIIILISKYLFINLILAANVKQRGDQTITSEDDLVAPSIETEVFTSKHTQPDTKKNEVEDVKGTKAAFYENSKCFEYN